MKKHIPTNESGRSMVEMLGVLAIMGVLSIGAVAGYRWAANEILNEVRKRAITSSQARISGHEIDLTEYGDNGRINGKYGVVADNAYNGDDRFFTLTVSDIPQGVCDKVVDVNWQMPAAILVDDNTVCGEGNNEMLFAFANDLKSGAVAGETTDPNEEHCWGHGTWDGTSCACEAGWSGDDCSMTQFCDEDGTCYDCDADGSFLADAADCSKCDGSRSPRFMDTYGYCRSCSDPSGYKATEAECAKCDGSSTPRVLLENGYCALESCGANQFQSTTGSCYSCSHSSTYSATAAECAKCDDSSTPRFMSTGGYCSSCSTSSGWPATEAECAKCEGSSTPRVLLENGYCALESCGANQFQVTYGSCFSCSTSSSFSATKTECAKCDDTDTPRFMSTSGSCTSCSVSDAWSATETECAKCDDSSTPRKMLENGNCALKSCGTNQFRNRDGDCTSCSASSGVSTSADECAMCEGSAPRFMSTNGYCYSCRDISDRAATAAGCAMCDSSSTPRFMSTDGYCTSCSDSWYYKATAEECAKCDKASWPRYMNGSYCYRCPMSLSSGSLNTQEKCQSCRGTWDAGTQKCS